MRHLSVTDTRQVNVLEGEAINGRICYHLTGKRGITAKWRIKLENVTATGYRGNTYQKNIRVSLKVKYFTTNEKLRKLFEKWFSSGNNDDSFDCY